MGKGVKEAPGRQGKGAGDARREGKERAGGNGARRKERRGFSSRNFKKITGFPKIIYKLYIIYFSKTRRRPKAAHENLYITYI